MTRTTATASGTDEAATARNEVLLCGRVAAAPEQRELPSGDALVTFRVVVDRPPPPPGRAPAARQVSVDTLDCSACSAWTAGTRRTALRLEAGDVVEVRGALRRRFWRTGAGAASRTEIEVTALRRTARALPRAASRRRRNAAAEADAAASVVSATSALPQEA